MFFDAYYCENFNFRKARAYERAGYAVSDIHLELFTQHYTNIH